MWSRSVSSPASEKLPGGAFEAASDRADDVEDVLVELAELRFAGRGGGLVDHRRAGVGIRFSGGAWKALGASGAVLPGSSRRRGTRAGRAPASAARSPPGSRARPASR